MSNGCDPCANKINNIIRQYTNAIVENTDAYTNATVLKQHSVIIRMSLPKTRITNPLPFVGYFQQTYGSSTLSLNIPKSSDCGNISAIAFSGFVDPSNSDPSQNPLSLANQQYNLLQGVNKYVTLGGGNTTITNALLTGTYMNYFQNKLFTTPTGSQYTGIVFDVENIDWSVPITTLIASFNAVFAAAKKSNYTVIVTVGHDGYGSVPGLMPTFLSSPYIDYLAPQLYDNGSCTDNPLVQTNTTWPNTNWSAWVGATPKIIPAVTFIPLFCQVQAFFPPLGITLSGGIVWNNATQWLPGQPSPCGAGPGPGPTPGGGASITINITNSSNVTLSIGTTTVNANGGTYKTTLNIPFTLDTTFNVPPPNNNVANIMGSSSQIDINFGYGNNGPLTNIIASGQFNGAAFSVGAKPVPSNNLGTPSTTTNTLNIIYTSNP